MTYFIFKLKWHVMFSTWSSSLHNVITITQVNVILCCTGASTCLTSVPNVTSRRAVTREADTIATLTSAAILTWSGSAYMSYNITDLVYIRSLFSNVTTEISAHT